MTISIIQSLHQRYHHWRGQHADRPSLWQRWCQLHNRYKWLLLLLLLFGCARYRSWCQQVHLEANREAVPVVRQDLTKEAIRTGKVELQGVIEVKPPLTGVVTALHVANGQSVREGDILFTVKSNATQAQQAAAYASYLAAKNAYEEAQLTINNTEWANFESVKAGIIQAERAVEEFEREFPEKKTDDNKEYQALLQSLKVARLQVDMQVNFPNRIGDKLQQARAEYQAAVAAYNASRDGTYRSPIAGRVENLGINQGENVVADVGDEKGTALFLLVPEGRKTITMQIGANDALLLQVGQTASVRADIVKDATFSAQIVRIDKVGKNSGEHGLTYRAWLEVDDPDDLLLLGIPVEITIQTNYIPQALVVPSLAVLDDTVTVVDADKNIIDPCRLVETGLKTMGQTEIISGLQEGEYVLVDYN